MNKIEKALFAMLRVGGKISRDCTSITMTHEQMEEAIRIMKGEYGIDTLEEELKQNYKLPMPPKIESFGNPLDGKAKRRERRKQERMKFKNKK